MTLAPDNLLAAITVHGTNRANEPGVHVHAILFNATLGRKIDLQDPAYQPGPGEEGRATYLGKDETLIAVDSRHLHTYRELVQRTAHQRLGERLKEIGFDIFYDQHGLVRIDGFPEAAIAEMSSRGRQIRDNIEKLGGPSQANRKLAQLMDRPNKTRVSPDALMAKNRDLIKKYGLDTFVNDRLAREAPGREVAKDIGIKISPISRLAIGIGNIFAPPPKDPSLYDYQPSQNHDRSLDRPARAVMASVVRQVEQREAVFDADKLVTLALTQKPQISLARYEAQIAEMTATGLLVSAEASRPRALTSRLTLDTERTILAKLAKGRGEGTPLLDPAAASALAAKDQVGKDGTAFKLNAGQQAALIEIVTTADRYLVVNGDAGVGKTTLFGGLTQLPAAERRQFLGFKGPDAERAGSGGFRGLAPKNRQAVELGEALQSEVRTVAWLTTRFSHLTADPKSKPTDKERAEFSGKRIILDEAFTLDNFEFAKVLTIFEKLNVKSVVFSGDFKQLSAPGGAGSPLTSAVKTQVIDTVRVTENQRQQQPEMLHAANAAAGMNPIEALRALKHRVVEITDAREEVLALAGAQMWKQAFDRGVDRQIITTTQSMRSKVEAFVRDALIKDPGLKTDILHQGKSSYLSKHLSKEEIRRGGSYERGDVLVFHGNVRDLGFSANDRYVVLGREEAAKSTLLQLQKVSGADAGATRTLQLGRLLRDGIKYDVFREAGAVELRENLRQTWGKSDAQHGILAGQTFTPIKADATSIYVRLENGKDLRLGKTDPALRFVEPGYADTTHRLQGATYKAWPIFVTQANNVTYNSFYVAITRGVRGMTLITESYDKLMQYVTRDGANAIARDHLSKSQKTEFDRAILPASADGEIKETRDLLKEARANFLKTKDAANDPSADASQTGIVYRVKTEAEILAVSKYDAKTVTSIAKGLPEPKENPLIEAKIAEQKQLELTKEQTKPKTRPKFGIQ